MIVGFPPFFSDSPTETCKKIMNWKQYLKFPPESKISAESKDLIRKLVCDVDKRMGFNGAQEIKDHPFFKNIDWNNIKKHKPMFVPEVTSNFDTRYFDKFDEEEAFYPSKDEVAKQISKDICFVDFDFDRGYQRKSLLALLDNNDFVMNNITEIKSKIIEEKLIEEKNNANNTVKVKEKESNKRLSGTESGKISEFNAGRLIQGGQSIEKSSSLNPYNNNLNHGSSTAVSTTVYKNFGYNTKNININNLNNTNINILGNSTFNIENSNLNDMPSKTPKENKNINFAKFLSNFDDGKAKREFNKSQTKNQITTVSSSNNLVQPSTSSSITNSNNNSNVVSTGVNKRNQQSSLSKINNNPNFSSFNNNNSVKPSQVSTLKGKLQLKLSDVDDSAGEVESKLKTATNAYVIKNKGSLTLKKDQITYNIPNSTTNKQVQSYGQNPLSDKESGVEGSNTEVDKFYNIFSKKLNKTGTLTTTNKSIINKQDTQPNLFPPNKTSCFKTKDTRDLPTNYSNLNNTYDEKQEKLQINLNDNELNKGKQSENTNLVTPNSNFKHSSTISKPMSISIKVRKLIYKI
jgi:hypothetical protein